MSISHSQCTLCQSRKIAVSFVTRDYLTGRSGAWKYDKCSDCGYVFLNPEPTEQEISDFYNSNHHQVHYHVPVNTVGEKNKIEKLKTWIKKQALINHLSVTGLGKKSLVGYLVGWVMAKSLKINLSPSSMDVKNKILEIGSSTGLRIALLKDLGFHNLHANEFNVELSNEISKKFHVESSHVDIRKNLNLTPNSLDFIVASMVLEHAADPMSFVDRIYEILKPGAYFSFSVPNIDCLEYKLFGPRFYALHAPYHLSQFNEASIKKLLHRFESISFYYQTFDRDWVVSARRTFQENPSVFNKIIRKTLLKVFFNFYGVFGKTSRVSIYARKPAGDLNKKKIPHLKIKREVGVQL